MSISECLGEVAAGGLDPLDAALSFIEGARDLLRQAREELGRGDLRQASGKVWGACALAIKAHALHRRGRRVESHAELWVYKNEVAEELGDWVRAVFRQADSMHKNFYENLATGEDVEDALQEVGKLVEAVERLLQQPGKGGRAPASPQP
uniref:HEPN domain-containing protein n=1 Tax=Thermofilum pendens TaxID=2269 RepID=A0A7C4B9Y7_THEPE